MSRARDIFMLGDAARWMWLERGPEVARGRIYTPYRRIISSLGLHQLDVYRVQDDKGTVKDIIRIYSPTANKVATIDLGTPRESLEPAEFLERVIKTLEDNKIPVPERIVKRLRQELMRKAEVTQQQG